MAVARQIDVHAEEDVLVAVDTHTIVVPERGLIAKMENVMVAVDAGEGKVAVLEQKRVKAIMAIPPQDQPQPETQPASTSQPNPPPRKPPVTRSPYAYQPAQLASKPRPNPPPRKTPVTRSPEINLPQLSEQHYVSMETDCAPLVQTNQTHHNNVEIFPGFSFCGCVFLIVGALLVVLAATLVLPCGRLEYASIPIIGLGCLTIIGGCFCCVSMFRMKEGMAIFCCISAGLLLVPMFIAGYFEFSLVFVYSYDIIRNGTDIGDCELDQAKASPFALTVLSYVFLVLTCCFSVGTCINVATCQDPLLYRCGRVSRVSRVSR